MSDFPRATLVPHAWTAGLLLYCWGCSHGWRCNLLHCTYQQLGWTFPYTAPVHAHPPAQPLSYQVRMAVVDLDNAPSWWKRAQADNMSAGEARRLAGTNGAPIARTGLHARSTGCA